MVIDEQLQNFAADLDQLYDDQFIETCAPWVIPYIGDLIGYRSIKGIAASVDEPRSEVANTISLRRRKGTVLVLEQLARDVTGWGAHAKEFFQILGATQYVKCPRPGSHYAPDVRGWKPRAFRNSGFSSMARKVDVHNPLSPGLPRYNLPNIGIFLWSLEAMSADRWNAGASRDRLGAGAGVLSLQLARLRYAALSCGDRSGRTDLGCGDRGQRARLSDAPRTLRRPAQGRVRQTIMETARACRWSSTASSSIPIRSKSAISPARTVPGTICRSRAAPTRPPIDPQLGRVALAPSTRRLRADAERQLPLRLQWKDGRRRVRTRGRLHGDEHGSGLRLSRYRLDATL